MARETEQREITNVHNVTINVRCDSCGELAKMDRSGGHSWSGIEEPEIRVERVERDRHDSSGEVDSFDVCPACWVLIADFIGKPARHWHY